jgi:trk system potassium uptake protein TrkH
MIPAVWNGVQPLTWTDAAFIASSAVCVVGLATVSIADFNIAGQIILCILVQIGGLGIISISSLSLVLPGHRFAFRRINTIQIFYIDGLEYKPRKIILNILFFTLSIEGVGAVILAILFYAAGVDQWVFAGIFHAVSAFCQAGFSTFPEGFEYVAYNVPILIVTAGLIILGGIGFIVIHDLLRLCRKQVTHISYHSKIALNMSAILLFGGTVCFFFLERNNMFQDLNSFESLLQSLFLSVNTRSSGLSTVLQQDLTQPSQILSCVLMFIGGGAASCAGGIRVTTMFVITVVMLRKPDYYGDINIFHHRLTAATVNKAVMCTLKAFFLLILFLGALSVTDGTHGKYMGDLVFESCSAFGSVGLSTGITADLSTAGKWIIIVAMFAGRVSLMTLTFPSLKQKKYVITYPQGSLLLE